MLRLIDEVVQTAHQAGRPVSVCGEAAADPLGAIALAALGVDSLSVPVNQFATVRQTLASQSAPDLPGLRSEVLLQRTTQDVRALLERFFSRAQS